MDDGDTKPPAAAPTHVPVPPAQGEDRDKRPPMYDFRLRDLRAWHIVEAICWRCNRTGVVPHAALWRGRDGDDRLTHLERKLRCKVCRRRGDHTITVKMMER
jgi:hypothetical protein